MATRTGTWSHVLKLCLDDFDKYHAGILKSDFTSEWWIWLRNLVYCTLSRLQLVGYKIAKT